MCLQSVFPYTTNTLVTNDLGLSTPSQFIHITRSIYMMSPYYYNLYKWPDITGFPWVYKFSNPLFQWRCYGTL